MFDYHIASCWLGYALVVISGRGVCWVSLHADARSAKQALAENDFSPCKQQATHQLIIQTLVYIENQTNSVPPLDLHGSHFQHSVWQALQQLEQGKVTHYQAIANSIGRPHAVRAVANAIGANRVAILIPCHRVVRKNGALGGYRWGTAIKARLLEREQSRGLNENETH